MVLNHQIGVRFPVPLPAFAQHSLRTWLPLGKPNQQAVSLIIQLAAMHAYGLLEHDELERFTERTRATIDSLAKEFS
jgi:hypothetical protein